MIMLTTSYDPIYNHKIFWFDGLLRPKQGVTVRQPCWIKTVKHRLPGVIFLAVSRKPTRWNIKCCTVHSGNQGWQGPVGWFEGFLIVGDLPPRIFHDSFNDGHYGPLNRQECWASTNAAQYDHGVETLYPLCTHPKNIQNPLVRCCHAHCKILMIIVDSTHSHTLSCAILRVDGQCHRWLRGQGNLKKTLYSFRVTTHDNHPRNKIQGGNCNMLEPKSVG